MLASLSALTCGSVAAYTYTFLPAAHIAHDRPLTCGPASQLFRYTKNSDPRVAVLTPSGKPSWHILRNLLKLRKSLLVPVLPVSYFRKYHLGILLFTLTFNSHLSGFWQTSKAPQDEFLTCGLTHYPFVWYFHGTAGQDSSFNTVVNDRLLAAGKPVMEYCPSFLYSIASMVIC